MKQGWEIKRLEELAIKLFAGGDKPKVFSEHPTDTLNIPVYANGVSLNGLVGYTDKAIVDKESITISARGTIGFCCIRQTPFVPIVRLITIIPTEEIRTRYLYYALSNATIENNGVAIPQLTIPMIKGIPIPIPPWEEQERIVAELDCLSGIIERKREQLRELDALAQSIFYQMFGDPITNEKGWEVKKVKDVAPQQEYKGDVPCVDGKYWLLNLDMVIPNTGEIIEKCYFDYDEIGNSTIIFNTDNVLYSKLRPYLNKVVIPDDIGYGTSELVPLKPHKDLLNKVFFASLLRSQHFVRYISGKVAGAKMPRVAMGEFREFAVILPPLTLQQEFAEKIEAIEKQKELIKQSITQTEELFNSRMDYYFN